MLQDFIQTLTHKIDRAEYYREPVPLADLKDLLNELTYLDSTILTEDEIREDVEYRVAELTEELTEEIENLKSQIAGLKEAIQDRDEEILNLKSRKNKNPLKNLTPD